MASVPALPALSGTTSYAYDAKNQLTQEASTRAGGYTNSYAYDGAGNPTTFKGATRTYNAKNQLTGGTGLTGSFTYDSDGNPTTYNGLAATFNVNDCLTVLGTQLTAGYTGGGLRAWKQNTATGNRTYFLYDGGIPICELDSSGNVIATNTFGVNGLVSRRSGSSSVFYAFDERGGTTQRLDGSGNVLSTRMTDAFGTPGGSSATGDPYDGFGAQLGYYADAEMGLQLCTFRYYDSAAGRWLNRDPIDYAGGINLYGYVQDNPVNGVDPSGLARLMHLGAWGTPLGLGHAYIIFDKIKCGGDTRAGFYPGNELFGLFGQGPGRFSGDENSGQEGIGIPWDQADDIEFEKELCKCVKKMPAKPYIFPFYTCTNWADDVWGCAEDKFTKPNPFHPLLSPVHYGIG